MYKGIFVTFSEFSFPGKISHLWNIFLSQLDIDSYILVAYFENLHWTEILLIIISG